MTEHRIRRVENRMAVSQVMRRMRHHLSRSMAAQYVDTSFLGEKMLPIDAQIEILRDRGARCSYRQYKQYRQQGNAAIRVVWSSFDSVTAPA